MNCTSTDPYAYIDLRGNNAELKEYFLKPRNQADKIYFEKDFLDMSGRSHSTMESVQVANEIILGNLRRKIRDDIPNSLLKYN